jgi:hypothetical protein
MTDQTTTRVPHLTLVGYVQWTDYPATYTRYATVPLVDADRTVTLAVPAHAYRDTRVVALPLADLSGSTVTLDLTRWTLFDLDTSRPVGGLRFTTPNPNSPDIVDIVERYVREARHLSTAELTDWATRVVTEVSTR